jgi:hypothetical protein
MRPRPRVQVLSSVFCGFLVFTGVVFAGVFFSGVFFAGFFAG